MKPPTTVKRFVKALVIVAIVATIGACATPRQEAAPRALEGDPGYSALGFNEHTARLAKRLGEKQR